LLGPRELWDRAAKLRGLDRAALTRAVVEPERDPSFGARAPDWSQLPEIAAISTAVRGCLSGRWDAVVTGPIHKADLLRAGFPHPGHSPYLAALCGRRPDEAVMLFAGGRLVVALATVHLPLRRVPEILDAATIERAGATAADLVRARLGVAAPRLAVCALNPHAGENGELGHEDGRIVAPAVAALRVRGVDASGPWPADTIFARALRGDFDLVLALYHDQGLIPVKTLDFGATVNITAGLPIVRTSVDHGTARDIAWTGTADPASTIAALRMAERLLAGGRT
jgi:4-hydroxythreonine-4-phosphate dehydrogenase